MPTQTTELDDRILLRAEVLHIKGGSRATLYRDMAAGHFPKPVVLRRRERDGAPTLVGWKASEVQAWIRTLAKRHAGIAIEIEAIASDVQLWPSAPRCRRSKNQAAAA